MNDQEVGQELQKPSDIDLTAHARLLAEERECASMIKFWKERMEIVRQRITAVMGDAELGTVNGMEAVHFGYRDQFNGTEFKKQYPNLYHTFSREMTETKLDTEWLRQARPDLYRQFQVRTLRVTYNVPGDSQPQHSPPNAH